MKRLVLLTACVALLASDAVARTWTDSQGRQLDADFVALDTDQVRLRRHSDGQVYSMAIADLSKADQNQVYQEAIDRSTKRIERNARDADAFNTRGYAYSRRGEFEHAINDYGRAIRSDKSYGTAYRNRGDLYKALDSGESEKHKQYADKFRERNRKRLAAVKAKYRRGNYYLPINSTTGNSGGAALRQLAMQDYKNAEKHAGGGGAGCGCGKGSGGGGGSGSGKGEGKGEGKGYADGKAKKSKGDKSLEVYPAKAQQGQTISLVADASAIKKGMPVKIDAATGKPLKKEKGERYAAKEEIKTVDFYRDSNGSGKFEEAEDQYLGADSNGIDGGKYRLAVSSAEFPAGKQGYFAVGRGAEGTAKPKEEGKGKAKGPSEPVPSDTKATSKAVAGSGEITPPGGELAKVSPSPGEGKGSGEGKGTGPGKGAGPGTGNYGGGNTGGYGGRDAYVGGDRVYDHRRADTYVDDAVTYVEDGDSTTAIGRYSDAIDLIDSADYRTGRANVYLANGDYTRAFVDYNEAVRLQPRSAEYYYNRGLALRGAGRLDEAIADYTVALQLDPKMSKAYNNRSSAYGAKGEYTKAVADATAAIELDSKDARAYFNRAIAHLKSDQYQQAIDDLKVVTDLSPNDAQAYAFRGHAYKKMGEDQLAQADFSKAKQLSPSLK